MRNGDRDLFVTALNQFRHVVAAIIDDGVMETAKAGAWIASGVGNPAGVEQINDHIGTILRPPLRRRRGCDMDHRHTGSPLWSGLSFCYCACCLNMLQEYSNGTQREPGSSATQVQWRLRWRTERLGEWQKPRCYRAF